MGSGHSNKAAGIIFLTGMLLVGACLGGVNDKYNRARYNVIVDRSPFGSDPVIPDQDNAPTSPEVKRLEQGLRLCFLLQSPDNGEIRAGFQNLKARKGEPKSAVLTVGESFQAMKLVSINYADSTATMEYRGKSITFDLTKGSANKAANNKQASNQPRRRFGGGFRRTRPPAQPTTPPEPQLTPEEQQKRLAEIRKKLQEQQMDIIRKGQPPLPIPLTKAMDDELVKEGVLPPAGQEPAQQ